MKDYDIIKAPLITEKTADLSQNENTFVFSVDIRSNKAEIKKAIEKIFDVKVMRVGIVNVKPKRKRVGKYEGRTNKVKKAIVKLAEGNTIDFK